MMWEAAVILRLRRAVGRYCVRYSDGVAVERDVACYLRDGRAVVLDFEGVVMSSEFVDGVFAGLLNEWRRDELEGRVFAANTTQKAENIIDAAIEYWSCGPRVGELLSHPLRHHWGFPRRMAEEKKR